MPTPFEVYAQQEAARSYQVVHGKEAPASALPMGASVPVTVPPLKPPVAPVAPVTPVTPPLPGALSQTELPKAPMFQAGNDPTKASDAELWSTIRTGAPGFSDSGVSGETFQQSVVEMSDRQTKAALERQRTGEIDVSTDSSRGAFIKAGVVGPQQYLPEKTDEKLVEHWRAREQMEADVIPRITTTEGKTYYQPPEYKSIDAWQGALDKTFAPKGLDQETELSPSTLIPINETVSPGDTIDLSVYDTAISWGYGPNAATDLATINRVRPENLDELPVNRVEQIAPESDQSFIPEEVAFKQPNILSDLSNPSKFDFTGVKSIPDEGGPWEFAVGGSSKVKGITPTRIEPTTIPGLTGYAYSA